MIGTLKEGDTIRCGSWNELLELARFLTDEGYEIEVKGWEQMSSNTLTITKAPEEGKE